MLIYKTCTGCGKNKSISEFHKQKLGKYGVNSKCKVCTKKQNIAYNGNPINKSRKKLQNNTPEAKEKRRLADEKRRAEKKVDKFIENFLEEMESWK